MLTQYPKIGRTTDYVDPVSGKLCPGQITAVNGDGTVNLRGANGKNYAGISPEGRRRYGSRRPNLLTLDDAELVNGTVPPNYHSVGTGLPPITVESGVPLNGLYSGRVTAGATPAINDGVATPSFWLPATAGNTYTLSALVKQDVATAAARFNLQLVFRDGSQTATGASGSAAQTRLTPTQIFCTLLAPVNTLWISMKMLWNDLPNPGDSFLFDLFCVREGTDPTYVKPVTVS